MHPEPGEPSERAEGQGVAHAVGDPDEARTPADRGAIAP